MTERTGLGFLEICVLRAVRLCAGRRNHEVKSSSVLDSLPDRHRIGVDSGYHVLRELSQDDIFLPLVKLRGNPELDSIFTEVQLTKLGVAALAAEDREIGPLPIALINGNIHLGSSLNTTR